MCICVTIKFDKFVAVMYCTCAQCRARKQELKMLFILFFGIFLFSLSYFLLFAMKKKRELATCDDCLNIEGAYSFARFGAWVSSGLLIFTVLWSSVTFVSPGSVKVLGTFGRVDVDDMPLPEGAHLKLPWQATQEMSVRQQTFNRSAANGNQLEMVVGDGVTLKADVSFYWLLNPVGAAWVYQRFGSNYAEHLQIPSAASAIRDVVGSVDDWLTVVTDKARIEERITARFEELVVSKLMAADIATDVAKFAFTFPKMDIRRVTPPKAIKTAIASKKAAQQQLERQKTEIEIAQRKAQKGRAEGERVRNMLLGLFKLPSGAQLPESVNPESIATLMYALAKKQEALAIMHAVEGGDALSLTVVSSSQQPIAIGATK